MHLRSSKFGKPWSIRANSLKELSVVSSSCRTDTAAKQERNLGKRGCRGMYGRDLAFGGYGVLGSHISWRS